MKPATEHHSGAVVKLLLLGDSGSGKTGSLTSLAPHYKITFLDFDNGLDYLVRKIPKEFLPNIQYETFTEEMTTVGGKIKPSGIPRAYSNCLRVLDSLDLASWNSNNILVLDSLTFFCNAVMNHTRHLSGSLSSGVTKIQDYGQGMQAVESFLAHVQSVQTNFNYIVISHLQYLEVNAHDAPIPVTRGLKVAERSEEQKIFKAFPSALGKKLPPTVASYFNSSLLCCREQGKRIIKTDGGGHIDLKSGAPSVPSKLPLETGLNDYFNLMLSRKN